jgi:hypothetical protein
MSANGRRGSDSLSPHSVDFQDVASTGQRPGEPIQLTTKGSPAPWRQRQSQAGSIPIGAGF